MLLQIGQTLYGYCGGYFDDGYMNPFRIEAIGYDWIIVRDINGNPQVAIGRNAIEYLENNKDCHTPEEVP